MINPTQQNVLTVEQALQNLDNAAALVNTSRADHVILQQSLELVKVNIKAASAVLGQVTALETEIGRLKGLLTTNNIAFEIYEEIPLQQFPDGVKA